MTCPFCSPYTCQIAPRVIVIVIDSPSGRLGPLLSEMQSFREQGKGLGVDYSLLPKPDFAELEMRVLAQMPDIVRLDSFVFLDTKVANSLEDTKPKHHRPYPDKYKQPGWKKGRR